MEPPGGPDDAVLRQALLKAVGPIGEQILEQVRDLPVAERVKACVSLLQDFAVEAQVISRLQHDCSAPRPPERAV